MIQDKLFQEISTFRSLLNSKFNDHILVESLCKDAYKLAPASGLEIGANKKSITMTFMALTHGNEVAGVAILNRFLTLLQEGIISLRFPIALVLANADAAVDGKRFSEKDLNRCFSSAANDTREHRRASELEPILKDTEYLIDLHQTIEKTQHPFFIFPFEKRSFLFANFIEKDLPIITHWGGGFSKEGKCSDEFVHANGSIAITLELGQKGFDPYQESLGLSCLLKSLLAPVNDSWKSYNKNMQLKVYTWGRVISYPERHAELDKGWYNFRQVTAGERLGVSSEGDIVSDVSGPILFPKYGAYKPENRPKEICRILRPVSNSEIRELLDD